MWLGVRHLVVRCATVWLLASGAGLLTLLVTRRSAIAMLSGAPGRSLDTALTELAACALLCCATWMWVTTTLAVIAALRGRLGPPVTGLRRWVLVACGVAAVSASLAPARADHHGPAAVPLPYPDRAVAPPHHQPWVGRQVRTVVVWPGDSLWAIARRDLGGDASDAEIVDRWHAVYAANRVAIGPDPDVLEPGLRLLLPGKDAS